MEKTKEELMHDLKNSSDEDVRRNAVHQLREFADRSDYKTKTAIYEFLWETSDKTLDNGSQNIDILRFLLDEYSNA